MSRRIKHFAMIRDRKFESFENDKFKSSVIQIVNMFHDVVHSCSNIEHPNTQSVMRKRVPARIIYKVGTRQILVGSRQN